MSTRPMALSSLAKAGEGEKGDPGVWEGNVVGVEEVGRDEWG